MQGLVFYWTRHNSNCNPNVYPLSLIHIQMDLKVTQSRVFWEKIIVFWVHIDVSLHQLFLWCSSTNLKSVLLSHSYKLPENVYIVYMGSFFFFNLWRTRIRSTPQVRTIPNTVSFISVTPAVACEFHLKPRIICVALEVLQC